MEELTNDLYILNIKTGIKVLKTGRIGKAILKEQAAARLVAPVTVPDAPIVHASILPSIPIENLSISDDVINVPQFMDDVQVVDITRRVEVMTIAPVEIATPAPAPKKRKAKVVPAEVIPVSTEVFQTSELPEEQKLDSGTIMGCPYDNASEYSELVKQEDIKAGYKKYHKLIETLNMSLPGYNYFTYPIDEEERNVRAKKSMDAFYSVAPVLIDHEERNGRINMWYDLHGSYMLPPVGTMDP